MNKNIGFDISETQENNLLWLINGAIFDFSFMYDVESGKATVVSFDNNERSATDTIDDFEGFLLERVHPDDLMILQRQIDGLHKCEKHLDFEIRLKETDGRRFRWHHVCMSLHNEGGATIYAGASAFVDSRKNRESELTIKARQDPLTGLLNKVITRENISAYIKQFPDKDSAFIIIDIDNFKNYNDCVGHLFGDEVIKEVASRIAREFRIDSFVGRVGGDEFLVFIKDIPDLNVLISRLGRLRDSLKDIKLGQKSRLNITSSIGISLFPDQGRDYDTLFSLADAALYHVKDNGKNGYVIYTDEIMIDRSHRKTPEEPLILNREENYSITNFAFHLLNESADASAAINLLLYKLLNEYNLEAIYVNELNVGELSTVVTYESVREEKYSILGEISDFSYDALKAVAANHMANGGSLLYDMGPGKGDPGNGISEYSDVKSVLQVAMRLFSKDRGCVNFVSAHEVDVWDAQTVSDLKSIVNLLTVCLYYAGRANRAEMAARRTSDYDALTGLMKEEPFVEAAGRLIIEKGETSQLAVVYYDISNFKFINETYGYMFGDNILKEMADFVSSKVNGIILSGRFYSDNILCLYEFPRTFADERIVEVVDDINLLMSEALSHKFSLGNVLVRTGIYVIPDNTADPLTSISNANMARKVAKNSKGERCVIFAPEMFEERKREMDYVQSLDAAIANEEFFVVMQPKVSGKTNSLVGAEALVRWKRPDGKIVTPNEFIPVFEKHGSIEKLDFYVYDKVLKYISERFKSGKKVVPISMNVSRSHLVSSEFVSDFRNLIDRYQVPTQFIELEITESIYLENMRDFNDKIMELRNLGIRISMDDFGSGYSSLNALNDLKIDLLKIDKVFMRDENLSKGDKTIIRFIIDMAKNLSMQVLCEGVETNEQRRFLNDVGCDYHQGFLYSKPVEISTFDRFIDNETELFARIG